MEINKYLNKIENNKKYKSFYDIFESDEYNDIESDKDRSKIFYFYALKFSSLNYKNISSLFTDLKKILENIDKENYLKNYNQNCYKEIINNYIEKIELIISERKFFNNIENYNFIKDIINKFKSHFNNKKEVQKEIANNLEELYDILKIKLKYRVLEEKRDRMIDYLIIYEMAHKTRRLFIYW